MSEPDALGLLSGGTVVASVKRSVLRQFSFPPQEHKFGPLSQAVDPITGRGFEVHSVDDARGEIVLKVGRDYDGPLPSAWIRRGRREPICKPSGCTILGRSASARGCKRAFGAILRVRFAMGDTQQAKCSHS